MKKEKDENNNSFLNKRKSKSLYALALLLVLYLGVSILLSKTIGVTDKFINIFGGRLPYTGFTGVLSSLANIFIIFMVVFYGKLGFITALILLLVQFPGMVAQFIVSHNPSALPGAFNNLLTLVAIILIYRRNKRIKEFRNAEVDYLKTQQRFSQRLFEQTATALVNAIDAKDTYSHGHSLRVAEYSEKIARSLGKSEDECYKIYYAALLHDVGKIGISNSIINKKGKLTPEEYDVIKQHPVMGNQILSSIVEYPYLSIGAHYHHERYDGHGYPNHLKGDDIPEIARIISVADAYDAMSSNRSYREAIPQQLVREEIVKGAGTQFDPEFARIMQELIDQDVEYKMKERTKSGNLTGKKELRCEKYRSEYSEGIMVSPFKKKFRFVMSNEGSTDNTGFVSLVLFDSLDGHVHMDEKSKKDLVYFEYCEIKLDGSVSGDGIRKSSVNKYASEKREQKGDRTDSDITYEMEAVKLKDHVLVKIDDGNSVTEVTVALPDSSRYAYICLTGEHCYLYDISVERSRTQTKNDYIKRIAEEISYIDGPEGDIPSIQIDSYRSRSTEGIELKDKMQISFHSKCLPTSRLIWHCPYVALFYSKDGKVDGPDYREYALIRLDGESLDTQTTAESSLIVNKNESFRNWDNWKTKNKEGYNCEISFEYKKNTVVMSTENVGLAVQSTTLIPDELDKLYVALTGDQCVLTDIRIK
ncbi:MAG: HD-GYP domain-containing protein [Lachnospiraceae bacterium]|nr:HD-GYP domain-containing protein [Lachnospiraceae bacterium]